MLATLRIGTIEFEVGRIWHARWLATGRTGNGLPRLRLIRADSLAAVRVGAIKFDAHESGGWLNNYRRRFNFGWSSALNAIGNH